MRRGWAIVAVVLAAACSGETTSIDLTSTEIELDAYSGLPNPRWQMTPAEVAALEAKLQALPASDATPPAGRLGYRGFIMHDGARRIYITSGLVVIEKGIDRRVLEDKHNAEDLLISYAVQRGHGGVFRSGQ